MEIERHMYINETFTFIHYSNISSLKNEIEKLSNSIDKLQNVPSMKKLIIPFMQIRDNLIEKLSLLFPMYSSSRKKRGLFDGLGNAINWFTGNLDANDKKHYDEIIDNLEKNEQVLIENERKSFVVNNNLVNKFNDDLKKINSNNEMIKNVTYSQFTLLNQILTVSLINLNLELMELKVNALLDSIEFCSSSKIHYSIIHKSDFENITYSHRENIASENIETLWKLSSVHCTISENFITYFISVPMRNSLFETFRLINYPVLLNNSCYSINVSENTISVSDSGLVVLDQCLHDLNASYCKTKRNVNDSCIVDILANNELTNCQRTYIANPTPFIKYDEISNCVFGYGQSHIKINNDKINPSKSFLIHLDQGDEMEDQRLPSTFKISKSFKLTNIPEKIEMIPNNFSKFNEMSLLENQNYNFSDLSLFNENTNQNMYFLLFVIVVIILIVLYFYYIRRPILRNNNVPLQVSPQPAPTLVYAVPKF